MSNKATDDGVVESNANAEKTRPPAASSTNDRVVVPTAAVPPAEGETEACGSAGLSLEEETTPVCNNTLKRKRVPSQSTTAAAVQTGTGVEEPSWLTSKSFLGLDRFFCSLDTFLHFTLVHYNTNCCLSPFANMTKLKKWRGLVSVRLQVRRLLVSSPWTS